VRDSLDLASDIQRIGVISFVARQHPACAMYEQRNYLRSACLPAPTRVAGTC
jgi:hypothetical protein